MLLDSYLPNYFHREVQFVAVRTLPNETYRTLCSFNMASIPWIRCLFQLRTILDHTRISQLTLRDAYANGGFILLEEIAEKELVVGAIGKIWRPAILFKHVEPKEFATFHEPGFGKVVWSLRCDPRLDGGTLITFELRISATDAFSTAKMQGYFSLIGAFSRAIRRETFKAVSKQLGNLFEEEPRRRLPGDEWIQSPALSATDGMTIEAPPEAIWPWLVQMGCLRGGWYSYDWLDNGGIPSATRVVSQWQDLKRGDILPATPQAKGKFFVSEVEPNRILVLGGCVNTDTGQTDPPEIERLPVNYWRTTWSFVLELQTPNVTRLIVRARADFSPANKLRRIMAGRLHNFMEKEQLQNLKKRAEQMYLLSLTAA